MRVRRTSNMSRVERTLDSILDTLRQIKDVLTKGQQSRETRAAPEDIVEEPLSEGAEALEHMRGFLQKTTGPHGLLTEASREMLAARLADVALNPGERSFSQWWMHGMPEFPYDFGTRSGKRMAMHIGRALRDYRQCHRKPLSHKEPDAGPDAFTLDCFGRTWAQCGVLIDQTWEQIRGQPPNEHLREQQVFLTNHPWIGEEGEPRRIRVEDTLNVGWAYQRSFGENIFDALSRDTGLTHIALAQRVVRAYQRAPVDLLEARDEIVTGLLEAARRVYRRGMHYIEEHKER